jgi:hypothetical protein
MSEANQHSGGCLCGGVRYAVNAPLRGVIACHCGQCRRTSGHYAAMTNAPTEHLVLVRSDTLDTPTGLAMEQHIYVADKSDYYTLDDDLPKLQAW